jgi:hypothetical protein
MLTGPASVTATRTCQGSRVGLRLALRARPRPIATRASAVAAMSAPSRLILVGDIHGQLGKLETLWSRLSAFCGPAEFATAKVVFLGDYCDRGPDTKGVFDFLCALRTQQPRQTHVFLAGNHDFAMAAFVGVQGVLGAEEAEAMARAYKPWREREGPLYAAPDASGMHLQGRRWAVGVAWNQVGIYNSESTFSSYHTKETPVGYAQRTRLIAAMPAAHLDFLRDMDLVHCCELPPGSQGAPLSDGSGELEPAARLIAVHAGLCHNRPVDEQVSSLQSKEAAASHMFIKQLSDRGEVMDAHPDLAARETLLVSGHHSLLRMQRWRLVIDSGGGVSNRPITAVVFPGRAKVQSD